MNFTKRLSLVFLIAILGLCEAVATTYELEAHAVRRPFKRPDVKKRSNPGADSPLVPHSPSTSPVASSISGEEDDEGALLFVPLKRARGERARGERACGGGSTDGSTVTTASQGGVLPRTAGGSPTLSVSVAPVVALKPKATLYRSRLRSQQQAIIKARRAQFSAAAHVPVPAPIPVVDAPLGDAIPRIAVAQAYAPLGFQKAREFVEPIAPVAVYNLTGNWRLDKKGNYQISKFGCTVTELGKEKIATVFYNGEYGAYLSPDFIAAKEELVGKHVRIIGPGCLVEEATSDISVVNSTWEKIALFKRFSSFKEGQAWVEQAIVDLGISLEKKPA